MPKQSKSKVKNLPVILLVIFIALFVFNFAYEFGRDMSGVSCSGFMGGGSPCIENAGWNFAIFGIPIIGLLAATIILQRVPMEPMTNRKNKIKKSAK